MFCISNRYPGLDVFSQENKQVATTGVYSFVRHPQYVAFVTIMFGFLIQWPTLVTVLMFPILLWVYTRLARQEEREDIAMFGDEYKQYAEVTPAFIPRIFRTVTR